MRAYSVFNRYRLCINILLGIALSYNVFAEAPVAVRDPTTPLGQHVTTNAAGTSASAYKLNSVLISSTRRLAIINGQTLREGQVISGSAGVKVSRISAQGVVLQQANKRWELTLAPTTIRKH